MLSLARPSRTLSLRQKGFTLIELVVVIIILGVLSAVAMPRFIDMGSDARAASVKAMSGALMSAATQVNMLCKLTPSCNSSAATQVLAMKGKTYWLNFGWPDAGDSLGTTQVDSIIDYNGYDVALTSAAATRFSPKGAKDPATCNVTYYDAVSGQSPSGTGTAGVKVTVTGC